MEKEILLASIDSLLSKVDLDNQENDYLLQERKPESYLLIDEMKNQAQYTIGKEKGRADEFLDNVIKIDNDKYIIQLSYVDTNRIPSLRVSSFTLIGYLKENKVLFASPLENNTAYWNRDTINNNILNYKDTLNNANLSKFKSYSFYYDSLLNTDNYQVKYYLFDTSYDMLKTIGIDYKLVYNGSSGGTLSVEDYKNKVIATTGMESDFSKLDPHDLFHDRLSLIVSRREVNRAVDEGCAYLLGGSWGYSWEEIFTYFYDELINDSTPDFISWKEKPVYFKSGDFSNAADYISNALIIDKIMREKDFKYVCDFLNIGPTKGNFDAYYLKLEELTGITKSNYNETLLNLAQIQMKSINEKGK
ncbi:MAG: hypothetical protein Kapaf2KO_02540 [Candidatus Kapaibacteriales bacterium]